MIISGCRILAENLWVRVRVSHVPEFHESHCVADSQYHGIYKEEEDSVYISCLLSSFSNL